MRANTSAAPFLPRTLFISSSLFFIPKSESFRLISCKGHNYWFALSTSTLLVQKKNFYLRKMEDESETEVQRKGKKTDMCACGCGLNAKNEMAEEEERKREDNMTIGQGKSARKK